MPADVLLCLGQDAPRLGHRRVVVAAAGVDDMPQKHPNDPSIRISFQQKPAAARTPPAPGVTSGHFAPETWDFVPLPLSVCGR